MNSLCENCGHYHYKFTPCLTDTTDPEDLYGQLAKAGKKPLTQDEKTGQNH